MPPLVQVFSCKFICARPELTKIWIDYYTYINIKDMQLLDPAVVNPSVAEATGATGFNYYCTGPRGNLTLIAELFKDK